MWEIDSGNSFLLFKERQEKALEQGSKSKWVRSGKPWNREVPAYG